MGRACSTYGKRRDACRVLVNKHDGKRPLGTHRCKLEDTIKMDLQGVVWGGMNCIDLA